MKLCTTWPRVAVVLGFAAFIFIVLIGGNSNSRFAHLNVEAVSAMPVATPPKTRNTRRTAPAKYTTFAHSTKAHQLECASCHKSPSPNWDKVRTGSDAFPDITDYPRHESCVNCHKPQFFRGNPPAICTICHTNPGPRISDRHPFPNPREIFDRSPKGQKAPEADFAISFPHDKHIEIVSEKLGQRTPFVTVSWTKRPAGEESCTVCHKTYQPQGESKDEFFTKPPPTLGDAFWLKKGTFKTIPTGHATCFTCHSQDSGIAPDPTNCNVCHKLRNDSGVADFDPKLAATMGVTDKIMLYQWRHRHSAGAFRHEFEMHASLECATCHSVATMNTLDEKSKKVPIASCGTCHATATTDDGGVLNYEVDQRKAKSNFACVKCHITYGRMPVSESHLKALAAAK